MCKWLLGTHTLFQKGRWLWVSRLPMIPSTWAWVWGSWHICDLMPWSIAIFHHINWFINVIFLQHVINSELDLEGCTKSVNMNPETWEPHMVVSFHGRLKIFANRLAIMTNGGKYGIKLDRGCSTKVWQQRHTAKISINARRAVILGCPGRETSNTFLNQSSYGWTFLKPIL